MCIKWRYISLCTSIATHLDANNINKVVKKIYEKMGINWQGNSMNKCFHDLQYTYATRQFEQGGDVLTVSKLLGHRNVNTTIDTYVHILDDLKDAVADATDDFYRSIDADDRNTIGKNMAGLRLVK
ncbi:tyrosine-type recombinase/integrase [Eubacterium aggregans]|nr:tyrosine-type recombinase/integrase [Eubacterium aggregans]